MANNVTTAAEWQLVADSLDLQKKASLTQFNEVSSSLKDLNNQKLILSSQLEQADVSGDAALAQSIQQKINAVNNNISGSQLVLSNIQRDIAEYDSDLNNAYSQIATAEAGPPNDNSTTLPANPNPGDNTDVEPYGLDPIPDLEPNEIGSEDPFEAQRLEAEQQLNRDELIREEQTAVGEEDPFEAQRLEAEQQLNRDELIREEQTAIGEEDPFEAQRLEAEQQLNDEQIENPFPDEVGPEDPVEQKRMEAEQQLNRDELARQDPADIDPEFDPFEQQRLEAEQRLNEEQIENAVPTPQEDFRRQELEQQPTFDQPDSAQSSFRRSELQAQSAEAQKQTGFGTAPDWRVRLSLAPSATYLYKANPPGPLLKPLAATNGVIFPYTPQINVQYGAHYDAPDIVHSNYKIYSYRNSAIDSISITGTFTAQDNNEANYLLAVIHFFRSVTKMFYGQDQDPRRGIPPPLCYLTGMGTYQFDNHPLAITNFNYNLPDDVDYIRAGQAVAYAGQSTAQYNTPTNTNSSVASRVLANRVPVGGVTPSPSFQARTPTNPTYVPTKMQIQITCIPIVSRKDISTRFSVKNYATGNLLQGSKNQGGGIW